LTPGTASGNAVNGHNPGELAPASVMRSRTAELLREIGDRISRRSAV
jgi:hypothetical protein